MTITSEENNVISHEDIRMFILDRSIEDNSLDLDLAFSDDEISEAMRRTAMEFNAIHPTSVRATPECFPYQMVFLNGIVYQLLLPYIHKLQRNDIDYSAGGVTYNAEKQRIAHALQMVKFHKSEFQRLATELKKVRNWKSMFGGVR